MQNVKQLIGEGKTIIKPYYHKLQRLCKWYRRIGLKCRDFTIISNNCAGGYVYQYFGIPYCTPTEGLYFTTDDYIKLIQRPEYYFKHEVALINPQKSTLAKLGKDIHYPVGLIDDIEVYFMHYHNPEEALSKWYRRASRMNFGKLYFLLTETELMKEGHTKLFSDIIERYGKNNGICLTMSDYRLPHTKYIPDVPRDEQNGNAAWMPKIVIASINWKKDINRL